jgi:uncharacterized membrane protein YfhO
LLPASASVSSVDLSQPDRREIIVNAPEGGVLAIGERAAAGWSASIDGRPAPLVRANAVLMALAVPPGGERIVLTFEHPAVRSAGAVSVLGLAGTLLVGLRRVARRGG